MSVTLDGDGGFTYHHHQDKHRQLIFKPVSVQALWTVIQIMHKIGERLQPVNNPEEDDWVNQYKINSPQSFINEWHTMADVLRDELTLRLPHIFFEISRKFKTILIIFSFFILHSNMYVYIF